MSRHTLRLLFSEKNASRVVLDANTNLRPYWVRGDDIEIEAAFENQDGSFLLAPQIGSVELVVRPNNESELESKLMTRTIGRSQCDPSFEASSWQAGGELVRVSWSRAESNLRVPDGQKKQIYLIYAIHTDLAGNKTTYGAYEIEVRRAPHAQGTYAFPEPPIEQQLTRAEAEAIFLNRARYDELEQEGRSEDATIFGNRNFAGGLQASGNVDPEGDDVVTAENIDSLIGSTRRMLSRGRAGEQVHEINLREVLSRIPGSAAAGEMTISASLNSVMRGWTRKFVGMFRINGGNVQFGGIEGPISEDTNNAGEGELTEIYGGIGPVVHSIATDSNNIIVTFNNPSNSTWTYQTTIRIF